MEDYDYKKFEHLFEATPGNNGQYSGLLQPTIFAAGNRMVGPLTNILKYTFRYKNKLGQLDLEKALWYANLQVLDHEDFIPPVFLHKRIHSSVYLKANPQFNEMQKNIAELVFIYNISGVLFWMHEVVDVLAEYIEDYDENER